MVSLDTLTKKLSNLVQVNSTCVGMIQLNLPVSNLPSSTIVANFKLRWFPSDRIKLVLSHHYTSIINVGPFNILLLHAILLFCKLI